MDLEALRRLWGEWEIRALLLCSLSLQTFLLFAGGLRKRSVAGWLRILLWLAYLLADSIAIYALGNMSQKQKLNEMVAFWAPFLILHLGGQDTIAAFAMEDNELWLRHLLNLVSQVALALYVYWKSTPSAAPALLAPAVLMFVSGVVKYGERTWALRSASMDNLRSSMLTPPDEGPNYAKFVEMYQSSIDSGLNAQIVIVQEEQPPQDATLVEEKRIPYADLVLGSYKLFRTFRRLFVDLILSFQDRTESLSFFRPLKMDQAFKVVEIELSLMYDSLHSKCSVIHGPVGRSLRVFTLAAPVLSLTLFAGAGISGGAAGDSHETIDMVISYVLLAGAVFLEICAILLMVVSPWTYAHLRESRRRSCQLAADLLFLVLRFFQPQERPRWSNKMAQYNLISYCLQDRPRWYTRAMEKMEWGGYMRAKTMWDGFWYTNRTEVLPSLKLLVFNQLKEKASSTRDPVAYKEFGEHRGQWVLQRNGCYQQLGWSVDEVEFDESILLWHIATDLCFYDDAYYACGIITRIDGRNPAAAAFSGSSCCFCSCDEHGGEHHRRFDTPRQLVLTSREISNYMLFLLVMRPFMMTASIGQIRFGDTCAEVKSFFRRGIEILDEKQGAAMLSAVRTGNVRPRDLKGDRSKSVLFDACRLAEALRSVESPERRWRLIAGVWAEMLCYAAGKCRGNFHAKQLSQGGELLTIVWLLMAHLGMGEQYRVETGHARAKLIIET